MAYTTENKNEPSRRFTPEKSSSALWLIAGVAVALIIIGLIGWNQMSAPVAPTANTPLVENKVNIEPPAQPAPSTTTTMDAQPPTDAPAATTIAPSPAVAPPAPATAPAQPPAANP